MFEIVIKAQKIDSNFMINIVKLFIIFQKFFIKENQNNYQSKNIKNIIIKFF